MQERLTVREMPVERAYPEAGPDGDCVPRRLATNFEYQFDRGVEELSSTPPGVGPHRCVPRDNLNHKRSIFLR